MKTADTNMVELAASLMEIAQDADSHFAAMKELIELATTDEGRAALERLYPVSRNLLAKYDKTLGGIEKAIIARRKLLHVDLRLLKARFDARRTSVGGQVGLTARKAKH